jgi:HAD superfamily hydrolase (TIGR01509 family)
VQNASGGDLLVRMPRVMIFDLDGTIIKLTLPLEAMRSETKLFYTIKGYPADMFDQADGISSSTEKAKKYFLRKGTSLEQWHEMEREIDILNEAYELSSAKDVVLIDGALETVKDVTAMGIRTAVLTNNSRPAMDIILGKYPLKDYFELIHTRHESPSPKPYPDGLLYILELMGVEPSEAVYVGDAMIDGVAASRAGVEFWGVASGETDSEVLRSSGARYVFSHISEIRDLLQGSLS